MKNKKLIILLILMMLLFACSTGDAKKASNFKLNDKLDFYTKYDNKDVILLFWSANCKHCKELIEFYKENKKLIKYDVLGVSINSSIEEVEPFLDAFPILLDSDYIVLDLYGFENIPAIVVINKNKEIINTCEGTENAINLLKTLMK